MVFIFMCFFEKMALLLKKQAVRKCTKLDSLEVKEVQFLAGPFLAFLYIMELVPTVLDFINSLMYNASINWQNVNSFGLICLQKLVYILVAEDPILCGSSLNCISDI